jgi:hypothetical protein
VDLLTALHAHVAAYLSLPSLAIYLERFELACHHGGQLERSAGLPHTAVCTRTTLSTSSRLLTTQRSRLRHYKGAASFDMMHDLVSSGPCQDVRYLVFAGRQSDT